MEFNKIYLGDTLEILKTFPDECVDCCVTSPPYYFVRDYREEAQIGLEDSPSKYIEKITEVFNQVKRVMKKTGTLWLNIGDKYSHSGESKTSEVEMQMKKKSLQSINRGSLKDGMLLNKKIDWEGLKEKNLLGIPWRVALSLQSNGYFLRQDIIWISNNKFPESVKDRFPKGHEYIFFLTKDKRYYFNQMKNDNGAVTKDVWNINTNTKSNSSITKHYATYPEELVKRCLLCGCPENGVVLDPFSGTGTTAAVAKKLKMSYIGIDISKEFVDISEKRLELIKTSKDTLSIFRK